MMMVFSALHGFLFGIINDNGNNYTEKLLSQTFGGANTIRYVVMGSNISLTANNSANGNSAVFEINGISYINSGPVSVPGSEDDRYYIHFVPKGNNGAKITISGTNDWTSQEYSSICLPFTKNGPGSYFYVSSAEIDSVASSNVDFLLINNSDYTNQNTRELPQPINGNYYIYYAASSFAAQLDLFWTPKLNVKVLLEGGF
ncbi:MAG: hypothetical protein WC372_03970 [Candidatus Neomarinimicrobiota bacterium]|jgi:hypothetical protein